MTIAGKECKKKSESNTFLASCFLRHPGILLLDDICVKTFLIKLLLCSLLMQSFFKPIEVHAQPVYKLAGVISLSHSSGL